MIVISYGIPKSGSTLAFELLRGMLRTAGFEQDAIYNDVRDVSAVNPDRAKNFISTITQEKLQDIVDRVGPDRIIALKTHSDFPDDMFEWLEAAQAERKLQVIASYRDPRDICLSLMDSGRRSREKGKQAFSGIEDLGRAAEKVKKRIRDFRKWAALRGSLRLNYDTVAFEPDTAIDAIDSVLNIKSDHARAKEYAFDEAHTLKNKAKRARYLDEMDDEQKRTMQETFGRFINRVCEKNDQRWFEKYREKFVG
jgi:hypothetical protein